MLSLGALYAAPSIVNGEGGVQYAPLTMECVIVARRQVMSSVIGTSDGQTLCNASRITHRQHPHLLVNVVSMSAAILDDKIAVCAGDTGHNLWIKADHI